METREEYAKWSWDSFVKFVNELDKSNSDFRKDKANKIWEAYGYLQGVTAELDSLPYSWELS